MESEENEPENNSLNETEGGREKERQNKENKREVWSWTETDR